MAKKGKTSLVSAVSANGWFYLTGSNEVASKQIKAIEINGQKVITYRSDDGRVAVLHSRCPHMGVDLSRASLCKGQVQCPFHGWEFSPTGDCTKAPEEKSIPQFANLKAYPVIERFGGVYVYFGNETDPIEWESFQGLDPEKSIHAKTIKVDVDSPWYMPAMNEFDLRHFRVVHGRAVLPESQIHFDDDGIAYVDLHLENQGSSLVDRVMRFVFGKRMNLKIENYQGVLKVAETRVGRLRNRMVISVIPIDETRSISFITLVDKKTNNFFLNFIIRARLKLLRFLTKSFFEKEIVELMGADVQKGQLTAADRQTFEFMRWLRQCQEKPNKESISPERDLPPLRSREYSELEPSYFDS